MERAIERATNTRGVWMLQKSRRDLLIGVGAIAALASGGRTSAQTPPEGPARGAISGPQGEAIRRALAEAPSHGIALRTLYKTEPASDGDLRRAAIAYAKAQHGDRIASGDFDKNWGLHPHAYDAQAEFDAALAQDRLEPWFASLPPPFARYKTLRDGLATYRKIDQAGGWPTISAGADLRLGDTGRRVEALRARLGFEDDAVRQTADAARFDAPLAEALKAVQTRHGITPTGVAGGSTLRALNVSAAHRAEQIVANLERWRWMPRTQPADRIEVNIAAATFELYTADAVSMHFLAAAGRPKDETPILISTITSVVFNPPWNVPTSIASKEIYPKAHRDKSYLAREGFISVKSGGTSRLVQRPGPKNALGQVKFDFANPYSVYLHDTSARSAFSRSSRSVSHGCVRLEKPIDLAQRLMAPNPGSSPEKVKQTIDAAQTVRTGLTVPMPVELLYWTAFPVGAQLAFRDDVYGWDGKVLRLLAAGRDA